MRDKKNKLIYIIIVFLIFPMVMPFYAYGSDNTSYVWSEISSPIVTTSSVLSQGERKFSKPYLW